MRVLLVEDHAGFAAAVVDGLTTRGHEVVVVESVPAALAQLEAASFDWLLTDYNLGLLGGGSGIDLLRLVPADMPVKRFLWSGAFVREAGPARDSGVRIDGVFSKGDLFRVMQMSEGADL